MSRREIFWQPEFHIVRSRPGNRYRSTQRTATTSGQRTRVQTSAIGITVEGKQIMSRVRIGELLGRMGKLSEHDIDEILHEQCGRGGRRFGEIALTWGLVEPEHIWSAWCQQLEDGLMKVDLNEVGIDTQAVDRVPVELAERFCAMPLRVHEDQLIIALSDPIHAAVFEGLRDSLKIQPRFVLADREQIREAIQRYYLSHERVA